MSDLMNRAIAAAPERAARRLAALRRRVERDEDYPGRDYHPDRPVPPWLLDDPVPADVGFHDYPHRARDAAVQPVAPNLDGMRELVGLMDRDAAAVQRPRRVSNR